MEQRLMRVVKHTAGGPTQGRDTPPARAWPRICPCSRPHHGFGKGTPASPANTAPQQKETPVSGGDMLVYQPLGYGTGSRDIQASLRQYAGCPFFIWHR